MKIYLPFSSLSRKRATKEIYYHGTSSKFLRSILKKGLIPNPKEGKWKEDPRHASRPTFDISRRSYKGIYLTKSLRVADGAAGAIARKHKATNLFICALVQPRSGYHDEDSIVNNILGLKTAQFSVAFNLFMLNHFKSEISLKPESFAFKIMLDNNRAVQKIIEDSIHSLEFDLNTEMPTTLKSTLVKRLWNFNRKFADWMVIRNHELLPAKPGSFLRTSPKGENLAGA